MHQRCGKRPFQTIIPGFATRGDQPWMSFGVMGGDMQPQGQRQIILNTVDYGLETSNGVAKHLTVAGPQEGVKRFTKLQGSRRPALEVSAIKPLGGGRAEAKLTLPASYNGGDLVNTTREALAAGLEYEFEESRSVRARLRRIPKAALV